MWSIQLNVSLVSYTFELDWVSIGPRFSNSVLQTLLVLLKKPPPKGHKLLILATTSQRSVLEQMELIDSFNTSAYVSTICTTDSINIVLEKMGTFTKDETAQLSQRIKNAEIDNKISIGIKKFIYMSEMASQDEDKVDKLFNTLLDQGLN